MEYERDFLKGCEKHLGEDKKPQKKMIEVKNLTKIYKMGDEKIKAVDDVSFDVAEGEFCCLIGTSGSGKSTILNLLAGIEKATSGEIWLRGKNIIKMNESKLAKFRQSSLGFVFQSYNLIGTMTAIENVELPLIFKRTRKKVRRARAEEMLKKVGLEKRMRHKPSEMSGGQQQRVGIARALVTNPEIIYFDEPTSALDPELIGEVLSVIRDLAADGITMVIVTHEIHFAKNVSNRVVFMENGEILKDMGSKEFFENPDDERIRNFLRHLSS